MTRPRARGFLTMSLLLALVLVMSACSGDAGTDDSDSAEADAVDAPAEDAAAGESVDQVNVGVVVPLSGANAQFGENSRNGIQLIADQINANGGVESLGGAEINLIVVDSTSDPTSAASAAQRLITQENVVAVLGAFASSLTLAISQVTERSNIPLLTMSFSDEITERGFEYVFQVVPKGSELGRAQFDYTLDLAEAAGETIERVSIMYEDTAYGTSQASGLRAAAEERGVEVVQDDAYPLGINDVTPLIDRVRATDAQIVFPVSYLNDSLLIIRTMRQQGLDIPAVGGAAGYIIPNFIDGLGEFADGVLSIAPANYDLSQETDAFRDEFGYFMVHEAIEHAAAMHVLYKALEESGTTDTEVLRDTLSEIRVDDGIVQAMPGGVIDFNDAGLNTETFPVMVQWQEGELVTVYPPEAAQGPVLWRGEAVEQ